MIKLCNVLIHVKMDINEKGDLQKPKTECDKKECSNEIGIGLDACLQVCLFFVQTVYYPYY